MQNSPENATKPNVMRDEETTSSSLPTISHPNQGAAIDRGYDGRFRKAPLLADEQNTSTKRTSIEGQEVAQVVAPVKKQRTMSSQPRRTFIDEIQGNIIEDGSGPRIRTRQAHDGVENIATKPKITDPVAKSYSKLSEYHLPPPEVNLDIHFDASTVSIPNKDQPKKWISQKSKKNLPTDQKSIPDPQAQENESTALKPTRRARGRRSAATLEKTDLSSLDGSTAIKTRVMTETSSHSFFVSMQGERQDLLKSVRQIHWGISVGRFFRQGNSNLIGSGRKADFRPSLASLKNTSSTSLTQPKGRRGKPKSKTVVPSADPVASSTQSGKNVSGRKAPPVDNASSTKSKPRSKPRGRKDITLSTFLQNLRGKCWRPTLQAIRLLLYCLLHREKNITIGLEGHATGESIAPMTDFTSFGLTHPAVTSCLRNFGLLNASSALLHSNSDEKYVFSCPAHQIIEKMIKDNRVRKNRLLRPFETVKHNNDSLSLQPQTNPSNSPIDTSIHTSIKYPKTILGLPITSVYGVIKAVELAINENPYSSSALSRRSILKDPTKINWEKVSTLYRDSLPTQQQTGEFCNPELCRKVWRIMTYYVLPNLRAGIHFPAEDITEQDWKRLPRSASHISPVPISYVSTLASPNTHSIDVSCGTDDDKYIHSNAISLLPFDDEDSDYDIATAGYEDTTMMRDVTFFEQEKCVDTRPQVLTMAEDSSQPQDQSDNAKPTSRSRRKATTTSSTINLLAFANPSRDENVRRMFSYTKQNRPGSLEPLSKQKSTLDQDKYIRSVFVRPGFSTTGVNQSNLSQAATTIPSLVVTSSATKNTLYNDVVYPTRSQLESFLLSPEVQTIAPVQEPTSQFALHEALMTQHDDPVSNLSLEFILNDSTKSMEQQIPIFHPK